MERRRFTREFKVEAVKLVRERGVSVAQAARDLDVHENVLRKWVKEFGSDPVQAFPGQGQLKPEQVHPVRRPLFSANQNSTPAALSPLRRQNPREEPGALAAHAGIWAGGEEKSSSLPRPLAALLRAFERQHRSHNFGSSVDTDDQRRVVQRAGLSMTAHDAGNPPYVC
jgi:transposase